ncbi:tRNA uridine 5-oxyacetic acid(34) methyltransferase CmoM [Enterobacteriaceae bacterium LUAb1]
MQDRNFDGIAEKFSKNIYGTSKGRLRQAILWQELEALLGTLPARPLQVLDAGGGEGQTGSGIAALGHQVLLCDVSAEMLQRARLLAREKGVSNNMQFKQIPVQDVGQYLDKPVDLVLLHAVLEWVACPEEILKTLWDILAPGGILSLMFYNRYHAVMRSMIKGNVDFVNAGLPLPRRKSKIMPDWPRDPYQVYQWLLSLGFVIERKAGIRVFHDYMQANAQTAEQFDALLQAEKQYCCQEPWINLGRYIHVTARKPIQKDVL